MTPARQLATLYVVDAAGRSTVTREPGGGPAPPFALARSASSSAFVIHAGVPARIAAELARFAGDEPPITDLRTEPRHADRYRALLGGAVESGPAFEFPEDIPEPADTQLVTDEAELARHFRGWVPGEIAAGRAPVTAVVADGAPVSICFCARLGEAAAEAGVETALAYRGRGFATRATAAWALALRAAGVTPLYSTAWTNTASLAVASKLGLVMYGSNWHIWR
jgi:hypothetical protein